MRNWRVIAEAGEDAPDADDVTTFADDAITVEVDEFSDDGGRRPRRER
ncbi:MAG: hypothetical protein R3A10_01195 [Caldilineaceae bacterium]